MLRCKEHLNANNESRTKPTHTFRIIKTFRSVNSDKYWHVLRYKGVFLTH